MLDRVRDELAVDEGESRCPHRRERHRGERAGVRRPAAGLAQHGRQPAHEVGRVHVVVSRCGQQVVDLGDRQDPSDRVAQGTARVALGARRQAQQRGHGLQVVLDPVMDLLGEQAAHRPARRRDGYRRLGGDGTQQDALSTCELAQVEPGADERSDFARAPRHRHREQAGLRDRRARGGLDQLGVGWPAVTGARRQRRLAAVGRHEHERAGVGVRGIRGGAHDLGQLLVERAGGQRRLGDARERLELGDAPLRAAPQARVLDRLADLRRDRDEQRDLVVAVGARRERAYVQCAHELVAREHRHREDRRVGVLVKAFEALEARVEVRVALDPERLAACGGRARDAFADAQAGRSAGRGARADRRGEHQRVAGSVMLVHEAGVGGERPGDADRDPVENLLEVERGGDRGDDLDEQAQVPGRLLHVRTVGAQSKDASAMPTAASAAVTGTVSTHAPAMSAATRQRTADIRRVAPTPAIDPAITCVVDTGIPSTAVP